jgi:tRNA 2-thiouridine synthesizing protein A
MAELKSKTPAEILDVLGRACPYPIVLVKKEMEKMQSGAIIKVLSDSQSTAEEVIPHYCEKHGYFFESVKIEDEDQWELYIQKA